MAGLEAFGRSVARREDSRFLRGEGRFTADFSASGQPQGVVLRSPHAHAVLRALRADAARSLPGILAVLTGRDAAAAGFGHFPCADRLSNRDGGAPVTMSQAILARERVRYVGEPVAFVVAETLDQARAAAELVEADYTPLPSVTGTLEAAQDAAPQVWEEAPGNLALDWQAGDAGATVRAFAGAARVVRLRLRNQRVAACPLEAPCALGEFLAGEGRYRLHTPSQGAHTMRQVLARDLLGIPETELQVITADVGGGFGVRIYPTVEHLLVLWAARLLGRPVCWQADRSEAMLCELHGRDHVTDAELALDPVGRFLALRVATVANLGAYVSPFARMIPSVDFAMAFGGPYDIPACHVRVRQVYSHSLMVTAYRGAGQPEAVYVMERLVDAAAAELGLSPAELRSRNMVRAADLPYRTAMGELYDSGDFARNLDDALRAADLTGFSARRAAAEHAGRHRGLGISLYVKNNDGAPEARAELRFDQEAVLSLKVGNQSSGQGHETTYSQLVSEALDLEVDRIGFIQGDSDLIAQGASTGGSAGLTVDGSAVLAAIGDLIARGKPIAARLMQCGEGELQFEAGRYKVAGSERSAAMTEVARAAFDSHVSESGGDLGLCGCGHYVASAKSFTNGCHVCEVEVDPETGQIVIVAYRVADDAGRILNPMIAEGQVHGGLGQGLGQALCEACLFDPESGQLLTGSLLDYALPRAGDLPNLSVVFNQVPCTTNPSGAKGIGEAGTVGAPPALVNAVVDALSGYGIRHIDMPLAPERVWRAIRQAEHAR